MESPKEKILKLKLEGKKNSEICKILKCSKNYIYYHTNDKYKENSSKYNKEYKEKKKNGEFTIKEKEKKKYLCDNCNDVFRVGYDRNNLKKYCEKCSKDTNINKNYVDWSTITKGEFLKRFKNIHQFHSRMRSLARSKIKKTPCVNCGYSKHVEVCHIKSISDFNDSDKISEINSKENLICLCPNCHWEMDNIGLKLP